MKHDFDHLYWCRRCGMGAGAAALTDADCTGIPTPQAFIDAVERQPLLDRMEAIVDRIATDLELLP